MKTTISFRLDSDLKKKLEILAEREHRSVNNLLNVIVEKYVHGNKPNECPYRIGTLCEKCKEIAYCGKGETWATCEVFKREKEKEDVGTK